MAKYAEKESAKRSIYDIEIKRNLTPSLGGVVTLETNFVTGKPVRLLERSFSSKSGKMAVKLRGADLTKIDTYESL